MDSETTLLFTAGFHVQAWVHLRCLWIDNDKREAATQPVREEKKRFSRAQPCWLDEPLRQAVCPFVAFIQVFTAQISWLLLGVLGARVRDCFHVELIDRRRQRCLG